MNFRSGIKIVSGGQTGADQGGLEAAADLGIDWGGWAPARWLAEKWPKDGQQPGNGTVPERFRAKMQEHPDLGSNAKNYRSRTKANIRDSDATLIVAEALPLEGGTKLTCDHAAAIGRPHHVAVLSSAGAVEDARRWLVHFTDLSRPFVLNVAGPRESKSPGLQARVREFVCRVLGE